MIIVYGFNISTAAEEEQLMLLRGLDSVHLYNHPCLE
jgi:hypothetical protein